MIAFTTSQGMLRGSVATAHGFADLSRVLALQIPPCTNHKRRQNHPNEQPSGTASAPSILNGGLLGIRDRELCQSFKRRGSPSGMMGFLFAGLENWDELCGVERP